MTESGSVAVRHKVIRVAGILLQALFLLFGQDAFRSSPSPRAVALEIEPAMVKFSQSRFRENSHHNICIEHYVDLCRDEIPIPL
jgi:hypothetical protein